MSLREWKKLAESKATAGKTSDAAITKSFRLDEIIEGLKGKPAGPSEKKRTSKNRRRGY